MTEQGIILAGGAGRRMGGVFKGALPWRGRPLLHQVADRLAPQVRQLAVNANEDHPLLADFEVFADPPACRNVGPLGGVLSAMRRFPGRWLLLAPVDMPDFPLDMGERLRVALRPEDRYACLQGPRRDYPLLALAHTSLADELEAYLAGGQRRVMDWLVRIDARRVEIDHDLTNCNRPEALT